MGTPDFAVPALEALLHGPHEVICVYTQPPRPKGRGQKVHSSPVHLTAKAHGIPVFTPKSLRKDEVEQIKFAALDADVAVVAAYGLILPKAVLEAPRYGCLNIHASLLPRWRGAAPIQYAIWKGDKETGISIMQMDEGLDTGSVVAVRKVVIRPQTTAQSLHDELSALGAVMIREAMARLAREGRLESWPQDGRDAVYASLLTKEDGRVDWNLAAGEIARQIRALTPWPGTWTQTAEGRRLKIQEAEVIDETLVQPPGTVVDGSGLVSCGGDTALRLLKVQPENAKAMIFSEAKNGGYIKIDTQLY